MKYELRLRLPAGGDRYRESRIGPLPAPPIPAVGDRVHFAFLPPEVTEGRVVARDFDYHDPELCRITLHLEEAGG